MPLAFQGVGYSYADPAHEQKTQAKRLRRKKRAGDAPIEPAKWGLSPDAVWALQDISFTVEDGEFFGIAGHTGSGKSTLIQHMNGLLHPTAGQVLLNGQDLAGKGVADQCRGHVGMVFQYPEHQLFAATVHDDVAFGPRNLGLKPDEVEQRVDQALRDVRLDPADLGAKSPFELSGGQQRRVAFAGVLAMQPDFLVLDEPVAGLDPVSREEFLELLQELHAGGLTVVMVSHAMDDLARLCDRILVLNEGRQFTLGTPAKVFADPERLRLVGLGAPAAQQLACQLREQGLAIPPALYDNQKLAETLAALHDQQGHGGDHA